LALEELAPFLDRVGDVDHHAVDLDQGEATPVECLTITRAEGSPVIQVTSTLIICSWTSNPASRMSAYQNKAVVYGLLFDVAAETLIRIAADPKHLGASIGATLVLYT
jgi:hypothetical protein